MLGFRKLYENVANQTTIKKFHIGVGLARYGWRRPPTARSNGGVMGNHIIKNVNRLCKKIIETYYVNRDTASAGGAQAGELT